MWAIDYCFKYLECKAMPIISCGIDLYSVYDERRDLSRGAPDTEEPGVWRGARHLNPVTFLHLKVVVVMVVLVVVMVVRDRLPLVHFD